MFPLLLIGLVGGLITGISPCVLPVLPAVFMAGGAQSARRGRPTGSPDASAQVGSVRVLARPRQSSGTRPYLVVAGLALSFSVFTLLGTLILSALHLPQGLIRWAGLVVLVLLGIGMIVPRVETMLERPFSRIPQLNVSRIDQRSGPGGRGGFVLGLALGAVYVPCAGPVLAAITVAGATKHIGGRTIALTLAFAVGTAIPLLIFALAGRRAAERVTAFRTHQRGIRIGAGVVVIALAVALTFNVTDFLQRAIPDYTSSLNTALDEAGATSVPQAVAAAPVNQELQLCAQDLRPVLQGCGPAPEIAGIAQWLNRPDGSPISIASLKGKVVLVDFWAYSCINCQRAIPHVNAWYSAYAAAGLEVIGVHTPEYAFEHVAANVESGVKRLGIKYPVALDNDYTTWNNYSNDSWPADYLVDATGQVRHVTIGEGSYPATEALIRQLLTAAKPGLTLPRATDVQDDTPTSTDQTPETYLGVARADSFAGSPANASPAPSGSAPATAVVATDGSAPAAGTHVFTPPTALPQDQFALSGTWTAADESITAKSAAAIELNFTASDVYLDVGGTGTITATVGGVTKKYQVAGAPDIYQLVSAPTGNTGSDGGTGSAETTGTLRVAVSAGLTAYSFTFG